MGPSKETWSSMGLGEFSEPCEPKLGPTVGPMPPHALQRGTGQHGSWHGGTGCQEFPVYHDTLHLLARTCADLYHHMKHTLAQDLAQAPA